MNKIASKKIHSFSIQGKRSTNEDAYVIAEFSTTNEDKYLMVLVFDGHGGIHVSKWLKNNIIHIFSQPSKIIEASELNTKKNINQLITKLSSQIKKDLGENAYSCGATLTGILMKEHDNKFYTINIGDSRTIVYDTKKIISTKDHKPNDKFEEKRINKLGGKIWHDDYTWRIESLALSRAIGDFDSAPYVSFSPDINLLSNNPATKENFIIIASDGLWDVMDNDAVIDFITTNYKDNHNIAKQLVESAYDLGSSDNITCIVAHIYFSTSNKC